MAAVTSEVSVGGSAEREWLVRPYDATTDEDAMHYLLGVAYTRSRAGQRAGASRAGRTVEGGGRSVEDRIARQRAFLAAHRPIWTWMLGPGSGADVTLAVDPERSGIIWAWLVTSGDDVVHAVGAKRSVIEAGLSVELVRDLLDARLGRHQVCTLELPQMRVSGPEAIGIDRPREWSLDPTWLATRMGVGRAA